MKALILFIAFSSLQTQAAPPRSYGCSAEIMKTLLSNDEITSILANSGPVEAITESADGYHIKTQRCYVNVTVSFDYDNGTNCSCSQFKSSITALGCVK